MKQHHLAVIAASLSLLALSACHEQPTQATQEPTAPTPPTGPQCYAYRTETDTVRLTLQTTQPAVTGQLTYRYFEKDRNQGTIRGTMHGDTLLADYTFQSEGTTSVRQVAFLRRDTGFIEGFGPVAERQDKMVFTQPRTLHFDAKYTLLPVACPR
ncbi:hypothetical protein E4631_16945 [Hymenobacter sp. UV11]|uniref:hypothetical protein n=1 Tax=Hymenobacter sp. UV11 TaxID=1849735 RepID=UPI001061ABC3|nr:hypothetical protein [Hymenobacter sp. UV11]TDN38004.1 hypothetical protein A8B98_01760 [Hymenobacter sp. UV11]TFZ65218.1 hypothetical protein E4631_16945 [Hymenobacter sp. UV11]